MDRFVRAAALSVALLAWPSPCGATQSDGRMNVLFIAVDDLNNDLGCYGHPLVQSPHIDRLAKDGVRFTDSYAAGPVCSATRCALQSGQNQARIAIGTQRKTIKNCGRLLERSI